MVFNNPELKIKLENILYPKVRGKIIEFFESFSGESVSFVAIPLLFEAGMEALFDKIIFIYCDDEIRLNRLIMRNGYTQEYAKLRMNSQQPQSAKIQKSDFVINNNSTFENLDKQIESVLEQLIIKD